MAKKTLEQKIDALTTIVEKMDARMDIVGVGEERRSAHRARPLGGWIGRRHELRSDATGCPEGRVVEGGEILLCGPARRLRVKLFAPLRPGD